MDTAFVFVIGTLEFWDCFVFCFSFFEFPTQADAKKFIGVKI